MLEKALHCIEQAVKADDGKDYAEALRMYTLGIEHFLLVLKYEKNESVKNTLRPKVAEYMSRAEHIKVSEMHPQESSKPQKVAGDDEDQDTGRDQKLLLSTIVAESPNVHWDDVAGLYAAKEALKETVVMPIRFPQMFTGARKPWRGILLYGPPGTGKSYLAKAVATEAGATFFSLSSGDLMSKWLGESERLVKSLFALARKNKPAVIFIDEIDSLVGQRTDTEHEATRRVKTEFLVQTNGVGNDMDGILVLAATNTPWVLDPAMRRRFEKRIYIGLPEKAVRRRMFELHLGDVPHTLKSVDFDALAEKTEGYTGSDILTVTRDAIMQPVRKVQAATHFKRVEDKGLLTPCSGSDPDAVEMDWTKVGSTDLLEPPVVVKDFFVALTNNRSTVSRTELDMYTEFTREFGIEG